MGQKSHTWAPLTCKYLHEYSQQKWNDSILFKGCLGKMIYEKDMKKNSRDTVPLIVKTPAIIG